MTDHAVLTGTFVSLKTLSDGTCRLVVEMDGTLQEVAALGLMPGTPLAIARLTQQAARADGQKRMIRSGDDGGELYAKLFSKGWFFNPAVCRAFGTDDQFRAWVQRQPSCISGEFSEWVNGEGRCEAAHVRRVNTGSGMGIKGEYACIPLTRAEHQLQHDRGEWKQGGPEFFDKKRAETLVAWIKSRIYEDNNITSLTELSRSQFVEYIKMLGIESTLPKAG